MPQAAQFDPAAPYNDLPRLPPRRDVETKEVLRACIAGRAALAELKQAGELIPNQTILINSLPLLEARDSSAIENIVTTQDDLFRYADAETESTSAATKEALRYRTALRVGFESIKTRPLTTNTAITICQTLRATDINVRQLPGTALRNAATNDVVYTPPEGEERLRDLLANWEEYLHADGVVDPLLRMVVAHYQFEAIHPFTDGNGRTGRILNVLYLIEQGLLDVPVLYLSRSILRTRTDYYRLLHAVTVDDAWEPWLLYLLAAVDEMARWTTAKIRAMRDLIQYTADHVKAAAPSIYSRELVELLFEQPYCRIGNVVGAGIAKRQTASEYLKKLSDVGVLTAVKAGREKLFIHPRLLALLTSNDHTVARY